MQEGVPRQFSSPEEEIAYLRSEIAKHERELIDRAPDADPAELEVVAKERIHQYGTFTPDAVLKKEQQLSTEEMSEAVGQVEVGDDKVQEVMRIALEKGVHNALSVLEKFNSPHLTDDVHRNLIELIKSGKQVQDLKEGVPPWHVLHMTLFEVALPELHDPNEREVALSEMMSMMTQFYAGMQSVTGSKGKEHYVLEVAVEDGSDDIIFYVAVPNQYVNLFEKQLLSLFPEAILTERQHDYNIFYENGVSLAAVGKLRRPPLYPLKTYDEFEADPLSVILNAFSKIEKDGGGAALQLVIKTPQKRYHSAYQEVINRVEDGIKPREAIKRMTLGGEFMAGLKELITNSSSTDEDKSLSSTDSEAIELFQQKIASPILDTNIRIAVSASSESRADQIITEIESTFHQFENTHSNSLTFTRVKGAKLKRALKAYSFREFNKATAIPLSIDELSTMLHFPARGIDSSPQFKQSRAQTAAAPNNMPIGGTLLGVNDHRGVRREIFITAEDRLRHFYIIGQTGTGKTTLMKNMIVQDIREGAGVCMIDPHGTDIEDVLGSIPPEREDDVIYFDPSRMDRVVGLNMLEFDQNKPEQKTFVVNELFSIFQKLYGKVPESMGPMFEQYFRNATMLVLEDPASGNTLMDISRVMADARYRRQKLQAATNPVVVQFWKEIATKAGGEAALENIVPYITSKFDVFTANDYMRPIIGQQQSAFNFRQVMDEQKILLVNLSKGRLGEINANLIGMIIVGKLLMAALSRVDDPTKGFPPFYLHMDEFQNVSTDSISAILSEARKYKLGLTVAHQYIAQLEEGIKDSVFGNVGSLAAFRVGPEDATFLESQFKPDFNANDLMNVPNQVAYMRMLANGTPTKPFSMNTLAPAEIDPMRVAYLIERSYERYGRPRAEIEAEIHERYKKEEPKPLSGMPNPFAT